MRKYIVVTIGAIGMELLAMEVPSMHLPDVWSLAFGMVAVILVAVALFEKPHPDERDEMIHYRSSHVAFLSVAAALTGILLYQTISRNVEPWTVVTMAALVIGKLAGRWFSQRHH